MKNNNILAIVIIILFLSFFVVSCKNQKLIIIEKEELTEVIKDSIELSQEDIILKKYLNRTINTTEEILYNKPEETKIEKQVKYELIDEFKKIVNEINSIGYAYSYSFADTAELNLRQSIAFENIERFNKLVSSDLVNTINDSILFGDGEWIITDYGKKYLDNDIAKNIELIKSFDTIKIYTRGFANEVPIKDLSIATSLLDGNFSSLPIKYVNISSLELIENRKYLNKLLSSKRALSVSNYLKTVIKSTYGITIPIIVNSLGFGEEYPCEKCIYSFDDEERRTVMFSIIF